MKSLHEFLSMGGYAVYVWPAYAVAVVVVAVNAISPSLRLRQLKAEIRAHGAAKP
ncbi:MAG TPA: heme exporter protein CcmD [Gammaproteobacteria bacterium]|jgi:heme exporter protein D|nr:heme exporter protein CcmD [Gammaproteobacteria bacterium]